MNGFNKQENPVVDAGQVNAAAKKASAGIWHYIKVFCTFFSLIATFGCICFCAEIRSNCWGLLVSFWMIGVVAALIVAPGKFFNFGWKVICACATFGWFLLPFPFDLVSVAASVTLGVVVAFLALVAVPAIFTVYTYMTDIRYDCQDPKKEILVAAAGVGAVLLCIGLFMGLTAASKAIEAPHREASFQPAQIYQTYAQDNEAASVYADQILNAPVSSEEMDEGYIRVNHYTFEQQEGNLSFRYNVDMEFEYTDGRWNVRRVNETKEAVGFTQIGGTWAGTGKYPVNLYANNQYVCSMQFSADGGEGTLDITHPDWEGAHLDFSVLVGDFGVSSFMNYGEEYGNLVALTLVLEEPVEYSFFGMTDTYPEIACVYSFDTNTVIFDTFDFGMVLGAQ